MTIAPTLLIGVGGQGLDIIRAIAGRIGSDRTKRIQMVVFDTDVNDLETIGDEIPGVRSVQTSPNMTVGEALAANPFAAETWFPRNQILEGKSMTEGAGQVRAISRLAFEQTIIHGGLAPLHEAISELQLLSADNYVQSVRVIVCGSLAGGTGSGMFLPLGLYLRNYLKRECNLKGINIRGFFLLPDIIGNTVLLRNGDQSENMRANAYAALRELDAFVGKADGNYSSTYPAVEFDIPRASSEEREMYPAILPYDHVFLMDYRNVNGNTLKNKDAYIQYAADTIYSFAISPISNRSNSTEDNEIRRISNVEQNGRCRYAAAGSAELRYPVDVVGEYVALHWAKESIGEEWVQLDRELATEKKQHEKQGREFDADRYATRYVERFDEQILYGQNPFYLALSHQVKGTIKADEGDEREPVFPITLWSLISEKEEFEDFDFEEDDFEATADDEANPNQPSASSSLPDITVEGDVAGKYVEGIKTIALSKLPESSDRYKACRERFELALTVLETGDPEKTPGNISVFNRAAREFKECVEMLVPNVAAQVSADIFSFSRERTADSVPMPYDLETWIHRADNKEIIHPNAVRYTVYKAMSNFRAILPKFQKASETLALEIKAALEDGSYDEAREAKELATDSGFFNKRKVAEGQSRIDVLIADKRIMADRLMRWSDALVMLHVCQEAHDFLSALSKSFEEFYSYIESTIPVIDTRIQGIEKNRLYNAHTVDENGVIGSSIRYVCVDATSLDNVMRRTPRGANSANLEGEVTTAIYRAVLRKAEHDRKERALFGAEKVRKPKTLRERRALLEEESSQRRRFFAEVFEESIMGFWKRQVLQGDSASEIDLDIVQALRKEAEYSGLISDEDIHNYVKHALQSGLALSEVFLPVSTVSNRNPIVMYHPSLIDPYDQDKAELLGQDTFGGSIVCDDREPNLNCQQILYYQACYGFAAKDLPQFMGPGNDDRDDAKALDGKERGQYYKAYFELIRHLADNLNQGSYISPHTDSRWHLAFQFPDIDETEGYRQRYNVVRAFAYSILFSKIDGHDRGSGLVYEAVVQGSRRTLEVNDRKCNEFYEIFEALMINNRLVYDLLEDSQHNREEESDLSTLAGSVLSRNLKSRALGYVSPTGDWEPHILRFDAKDKLPGVTSLASIYEIPLFYELTKPANANHGRFIAEIIESTQEVIFSYMFYLANSSELKNIVARFFIEQYLRFRRRLSQLVPIKPGVAHAESVEETRIKVDHWFAENRANIVAPLFEFWDSIKRIENGLANTDRAFDIVELCSLIEEWIAQSPATEAHIYTSIWETVKPDLETAMPGVGAVIAGVRPAPVVGANEPSIAPAPAREPGFPAAPGIGSTPASPSL